MAALRVILVSACKTLTLVVKSKPKSFSLQSEKLSILVLFQRPNNRELSSFSDQIEVTFIEEETWSPSLQI